MERTELYAVLEEQYFGENMHEQDEIKCLPELLRGVSVFVDVGASLGQYTFFASRILKNARLYCLEADWARVQRLRELAAEWEEDSSNTIKISHVAAAEKNDKADFYVTNANISGGLFVHNPSIRDTVQWTKCEVDCVTLDSYCKGIEPDLIKIDVEGSEYRVLQGARGILAKGRCRFLVEIHPWGDESLKRMPSDVFKLFAQFGYDFRRTHRHWLFEKSNKSLKRFIKNKCAVMAMDNAWLRSTVKSCVLKLRSLKRFCFN
jgi:FkbM family methyltransferase